MGDLVTTRLDESLRSVAAADESLAQSVIDRDDEVNETYLRLENRCVDLFALQQPVAGDLRFVTASFKIITDLERVGDLAVNLASYARAETRAAPETPEIDAIGEAAKSLLDRSLAAYESEDPDACRAIAADDDEVDALCQRASESVVRDLVGDEAGRDAWSVERVLDDVSRLLLTVRDLERVGDHAVNIAARTVYMVDSDPELI